MLLSAEQISKTYGTRKVLDRVARQILEDMGRNEEK